MLRFLSGYLWTPCSFSTFVYPNHHCTLVYWRMRFRYHFIVSYFKSRLNEWKLPRDDSRRFGVELKTVTTPVQGSANQSFVGQLLLLLGLVLCPNVIPSVPLTCIGATWQSDWDRRTTLVADFSGWMTGEELFTPVTGQVTLCLGDKIPGIALYTALTW